MSEAVIEYFTLIAHVNLSSEADVSFSSLNLKIQNGDHNAVWANTSISFWIPYALKIFKNV